MESKLLIQYWELRDICSKEATNKLSFYQLYNYKIKLEASLEILGFCLLYKQSIEELLATKKYITEYLSKGFIKYSQAPFAILILFVQKANSTLQLCINF